MTDEQARIDGILEQTRYDYRGDDRGEIETRLRQRFDQSGIVVDDARLAAYVEELAAAGGTATVG